MSYDLIGAEELIGEDFDISGEELIGALFPGRRKKKAAAVKRALAARANAFRGHEALSVAPRFARVWPLPLGRQAAVAAAATTTLTATTQRLIKLKRLVLNTDTAADLNGWLVTSLVVGVDNQVAAVGNMPAAIFGPSAVDTSLEGNTIEPGQAASVGLTNNNAGASSISGAIIGLSAQ